MKKLVISTIIGAATLGAVAIPAIATAKKPVPLSPNYQMIYCYPTGTYWQNQISHFSDYYHNHNSYYLHHYGAGTKYCPADDI